MDNDIRTSGILLKKVLLPNDDAFLEFFTKDLGRISLPVRGFSKSKKKSLEIDYFREIHLHIQKTRTNFRIKTVYTEFVFSQFQTDIKLNTFGFEWLLLFQSITSEEQPDNDIYNLCKNILISANIKNVELLDLFLRIQLLNLSGFMVRFDLVREDTYFDPHTFNFFNSKNSETFFIKNEVRQCIEFLRRSTLELVLDKEARLPLSAFPMMKKIINLIEKNHY